MCVHVCVCMCVCVCVGACMCVCVCACACMHVHARACACSYISALHGADAKVGTWGKPTPLLGPAPKCDDPQNCTFSCMFLRACGGLLNFFILRMKSTKLLIFQENALVLRGVFSLKKKFCALF